MSDLTTQYQMFDPLIDDIEVILDIRASALTEVANIRSIISVTGEATQVQKKDLVSLKELLAETRMFLKQADPQQYGYPIHMSRRIRV